MVLARNLALLLVLSLPLGATAAPPLVCIDPGHGGDKLGAVGPKGVLEKDVVLKMARLLKAALEKDGAARVILTRESDEGIGLRQRIEFANEAKADLFVSIHLNSMPAGQVQKKARGPETYFLSSAASGEDAQRVAARENAEDGESERPPDELARILDDLAQAEAHRDASVLAYAVQQRLVRDLKAKDRGVHQAPFVVLRGARMPAILVEIGFLSHRKEAALLVQERFQREAMSALANAITEFWGEMGKRGLSEGGQAAGEPVPARP